MAYRVCPNCGAHLDLEEKCDCVEDLYEKKEFVKIFKILLLKADVDLSDLQLIDNETVEA